DGAEVLPVLQLALQRVALDRHLGDFAAVHGCVELARPHLGRLAAALAREDQVERKEEKDEDGPEKERLVRLSHLTLLRNGLAGRNGSKSGDASLLARERLAQGIHFRAEFEPYRVGRRRGASGARGEPLDPEDAA